MERHGNSFQEVPLVVTFWHGLCASFGGPAALLVDLLFSGNPGTGWLRFIVSGGGDLGAPSSTPGV
jgi:hypothetical protein